jgi:hypothetical protein
MKTSSALVLALASGLAGAAACGGSGDGGGSGFAPGGSAIDDAGAGDATQSPAGGGRGGGLGGGGSGSGGTGGLPGRTLMGLSIIPPQANLESLDGQPATQAFQVVGAYSDGSTGPLGSASWTVDNPQVGAIAAPTGVYTASGSQGGVVHVQVSAGGKMAAATLVVKLHIRENPDHLPAVTQALLAGATLADAEVKWAYPYDGTVFPRGIGEAPLMWLYGGASDAFFVKLTSPTFELETFTTAIGGRYDFSDSDWASFANSTSGAAELKVARWNGVAATVIADQHWTVAPGSMKGTIYYWAINTGRVMRVRPGATAPDDFLAGRFDRCPSCHTVSANGQRLLMSAGDWTGGVGERSIAYDLKSGAYSPLGPTKFNGGSRWVLPAVSPDGAVMVQNFSPVRFAPWATDTGAFEATTGQAIPDTGLEGHKLGMPAFSPDGRLLAYVDVPTQDLRAYDWDPVRKKATNDRVIVASAAIAGKTQIQYPTVSPDHKWIVYGRGNRLGSLGVPGDLYAASVENPGVEIPLGGLDGWTYPFAAGPRDTESNYEPTFAPVAAGGYFWIVFHSRRTWGNAITSPAFVAEGQGVKQLWVAAFDQSPVPSKDPSHPAFHLPGQDPNTLNMRGYWALEPCKGNGEGCQAGIDCCGGYCAAGAGGAAAAAGAPVCASSTSGCSLDGDRCSKSSDCCGAAAGVTCINGVCAVPPPQ